MNKAIVVFVEDPGAVNCILPVLPLFQAEQIPFMLCAEGAAVALLDRQGYLPIAPDRLEGVMAQRGVSLIVTGTAANLDTFGLQLIAAARRHGIPSLGVVDAAMNAERRFCGRSRNPLEYIPDALSVPDHLTAERFRALGMSQADLHVCGHPHFDALFKRVERGSFCDRAGLRNRYFPEIDPERKLLLFAGEPETHLCRNPAYRLAGRGGRSGRIAIVMEEFLDSVAGLAPRPATVLQLHPRSRIEEIGPLAEEFDAVRQGGDTLELLAGADGVVGLTSMLLMEAALIRRPTLSILPLEDEKEWLPGIGWEATDCVTCREMLPEALNRLLGIGVGPDVQYRIQRGAGKNLFRLIQKMLCPAGNKGAE